MLALEPAQVQEQAPGPVADLAAAQVAQAAVLALRVPDPTEVNSGQGGPQNVRPGRSQDPTGR